MLPKSLFQVALAGAAAAITPSGFAPASNVDLIVAFGNTLAVNGKSMTKEVYVLRSAANATAIAPYFGPSPPNKAPNTHRYTQLLLDTTNNPAGLESLTKAGAMRTSFNAVNVVSLAGVKVVAGNSFDVTNGTVSAAATGSMPQGPRPAAAINPATLVAANITKVTATAQLPGVAAASGVAAGSGIAAASGVAVATGGVGNASAAANGTVAVPGGAGGMSKRAGGAYGAALLALAAALFLF
ncbi:hypothetical protein BUE80_DR008044 [Diplocarpon rosae]|nr:hypothetical protein BUE80_DR008044 [Diplocarpon rosae]